MSNYAIAELTTAGETLLAKRLEGKTVKFSKFTIGDGQYSGVFSDITALVNELFKIDIQSYEVNTVGDKPALLFKGAFDDQTFGQDFYYREAGLWAIDPDAENDDSEVLVAYVNYGSNVEKIAAGASDAPVTIQKKVEFVIALSNTANITVYLNAALEEFQTRNEKGQESGYAGLDKNKKLFKENLPDDINNMPFTPTSGSMDESGNNNSLYLPDAPVIVTKSLPTFASAAETTNGKDGVKVTSSLYPESIYKIVGQNSVVSSGFRVAYNAQYTVTFTFDIPKKVTAFTFLGEAVNNVTWLSRFTVFEGSNNGQNWTPIFTPESTVATEYSNKSINNNNSYLMYRFTIMVSSGYVNGSGRPQGLGAINLFYENVVDAGSNVVVLKASEETPYTYMTAKGVIKTQKTSLALTIGGYTGNANIAINDGTLEQIGKIYRQPNEPDFVNDKACILEAIAIPVQNPSGLNAIIKAGTKILIPNGLGVGIKKYLIHTIPSDISVTFTAASNALGIDTSNGPTRTTLLRGLDVNKPTSLASAASYHYYAVDTNIIYMTTGSTTANWSVWLGAILCDYTATSSAVTSLTPYTPQNGMPVWLDTSFSKSPQLRALKLNDDGERQEYGGVPSGFATMQNGIVIAVENAPYNVNGYDCNLPTLQNAPNKITNAISALGMPSDVFIDMTLPASGNNVTAPLTGRMMLDKNASTANQFIALTNTSSSSLGDICYPSSATSGVNLKVSVDCTKGDIISVAYSAAGATNLFRCIKDKGAQQ